MLTFLRAAKQTIDKERAALKQNFDLGAYLNATDFEVTASPFPHVVVDNFFKDDICKALLKHFTSVLDRGFSEKDDQTRFHPFLNLKGEYEYDGYVYVPQRGESETLDVFFSVAWNLLFSKLFRKPTSWCTSLAYHHHSVGDRTGFVHHDYAFKRFSPRDRLSNGVIFREQTNNHPGDTTLYQEMRIITLLYYLGGHVWEEGDGGYTGLYQTKEGSPVKLVVPKNNRLLAFQISPKSFHAFQKSFKPRSSIVQWFHIDPAWCKKKFGFVPAT